METAIQRSLVTPAQVIFPRRAKTGIDWNSGETHTMDVEKDILAWLRTASVRYPYICNFHNWLMDGNISLVNFIKLGILI